MKIFFLTILIFCNILSNNSLPKNKTALIFGITGQDGCYLTKFLLEKDYNVIGITRKISFLNTKNLFEIIEHLSQNLKKNLNLVTGDITDNYFVSEIIKKYLPDEVYNLAAQSSVKISFEEPLNTLIIDAIGTLNILITIQKVYNDKKIRFYQASTCEIFGKCQQLIDENSPFYPKSPYGIAKACAYWSTVNYREAYNIFACNGILFNHESPLRSDNFVTKAIIKGVVKISKGLQDCLYLGNLNAKRDWGYAGDFVEAMWLMLQQDFPEDFIIATGKAHSVREIVEIAFKELNIEIEWTGHGINEIGIDKITRKKLVAVDPKYFRPTETDCMLGNPEKAHLKLGWKPKISFKELIKLMIHDEYTKL